MFAFWSASQLGNIKIAPNLDAFHRKVQQWAPWYLTKQAFLIPNFCSDNSKSGFNKKIDNNWFNRENNMVTRNCFLNNYYHITFEKAGLLPVFFTVGHAWTDASSCSDWNDWRLVARQIEIWSHIIGVRSDSYGDAWALLLVLIKHWRP